MAPTTQDAVEDVSGSTSRTERRRRRRRRHRHDPAVTDHLSAGAIQQEAEPSSQQGERKAAVDEQTEGERRKRKRKSSPNKSHRKEADTASSSRGASHASDDDSEASSRVSSPLLFPLGPNPDDFGGRDTPEFHAADDVYFDLLGKYHEKARRIEKYVTLVSMPSSSLVKEFHLNSVRESAAEKVLEVAKVILRLSSYVDGKLMACSSGFLIGWDEESRQASVLTSAHIICSKYTSLGQWSGKDEYSPNAKVVAHLLDEDETTVPAQLLHYDKHINMALFTVGIESCAKIAEFNSNDAKYGQEIFVMGRDENLNLTVDYDIVQFRGPSVYERPHYMFTSCAVRKCGAGGPVIDFNGKVLGMANHPGCAFIPSSIISFCLAMWKKHQCIPRLHFGMQFIPIKLLDPIRVERIIRKCNVDSGLIVKEVSNGSIAEGLGVRRGDIIKSVNGKDIATTIELESLNLEICKNHLDQGGAIGSWMDIPVVVLHLRKGRKGPTRTLSLRLNVSDGIEVFANHHTPFKQLV